MYLGDCIGGADDQLLPRSLLLVDFWVDIGFGVENYPVADLEVSRICAQFLDHPCAAAAKDCWEVQ